MRRFLLALILSSTAFAQAGPARVNSDLLVSTQWLAAHLSDPKLVIVHVGSARDYGNGHIPGARLLTGDRISSGEAPGTELLPDAQLKSNLEAIGISDDSRVVIYTPDWQPTATRLFFTLEYLGFTHAAMLDGGFEAWVNEKRPTSTEQPAVTHGSLTIHPHPELVVKMDAVKQLVAEDRPATLLIDSRPLRRYRAGHLPGAKPMFWEMNLSNADALAQMLKNPEELRKMYEAAGAAPGRRIVSYCEVGLQASYTYFIARYLGYDAAMYDGSYSEWSAAKQPTVRGDNPR